MSAAPTLEKMYELCDVIDAAKDKSQCHDEYNTILKGTKGGANEKKFASQLIVRYFNHFSDLRDQALEAMFELCEDDDVNIRKSVIKELPSLCKEGGQHISKIADVLVQLLQTEDSQEQQLVNNALSAVMSNHVKDTLTTLFIHILNPDVDLIRERAVKFLAFKLKALPDALLTNEIQDYVLQESKKVLQECSGDEFLWFMHMLSQMKNLQTMQGRQLLLDIVTEQADLDKPFEPEDPDRVDQVVQCVKQAVPFMSKNVHSTKFLNFLIEKVIPVLPKISGENAENTRLELLRLTADLSTYSGDLQEANEKMDIIEKTLLDYLPVRHTDAENGAAADSDEPKLQFSEIECLIYALHQLGKRNLKYFTSEEKKEAVKELRSRLLYLARVTQAYSNKLKEALKKTSKEEMKSDANRLKQVAVKTTSNISVLVKDLMHTTPTCKSTVSLSWKAPSTEPKPVIGEKRPSTQMEPTSPNKNPRKDVQRYQPPSGKFSEKAGTYQGSEDNEGGASARGGFRGRGRGRGFGFRGGQSRGGSRGRYTWRRTY